jgi:hypothetical protein
MSFFSTPKPTPLARAVALLKELEEDPVEVKSTPMEVDTAPSSSLLAAAMIRTGGTRSKGSKALAGDGTVWSINSQAIPRMKFKYPDNQVFKFVQTSELLGALSQSNIAFTGTAASFSAAAVNQFSSFAAVFDQYKITEIELWIVPRHAVSPTTASTTNDGLLYSVVDYDDSTALTTAAAHEQYTNCVVSSSTSGHYRRFIPHVAMANYAGTFTGYTNSGPVWIDCNTTGTLQYGVKFGVSACDVAGNANAYDLIYRLHVEFRNVR